MFTENSDNFFFNSDDSIVETVQLTTTLVNPYDGSTVDVDDTYILPTEIFDGLGGFDVFILDNTDGTNKALFLETIDEVTGNTVQNFINIERFFTFSAGKVIINLASNNFSLGDIVISGTGGDSVIWGNDGNDNIVAASGNAHVHGGAGDDVIFTLNGNDTMIGGEGSDTFQFSRVSMQTGTTDIIIENSSSDINVIEYTSETTDIGDLAFVVSGTDLHITSAGHTLILQGQFSAPDAGIDTLIFEDSSTFDLRTIDGNSDPVAVDDDITAVENTPVSGNVLADNGNGVDSDPNSNPLSVQPATINTANGGTVILLANGDFTYTPAAAFLGADSFDYTLLDGNGGSDFGTVNITVNVFTIEGTNGDDVIPGTVDADIMNGNNGNDLLDGNAGNDTISGGSGNDSIRGQADDDEIFGNEGDDNLSGNFGDDTIDGGTGVDRLQGDGGNDLLNGGAEKDVIFGGGDQDTLNGGDGNDRLNGDGGDDSLDGGNGGDVLFGGEGADSLVGDSGNDTLRGGDGADDLTGDAGRDSLFGEAGNDVIQAGDENDQIFGGLGDDFLGGDAGNDGVRGEDGNDTLEGGAGLDRLFGDDGFDSMSGGSERDAMFGGLNGDTLNGEAGNDNLFGEEGDDLLNGGDGLDVLDGGAGADSLLGGLGNDILRGGAGDDTLMGEGGFDRLLGGEGNDLFVFRFDSAFGLNAQVLDFDTGDRIDVTDVALGLGADANSDALSDFASIVVNAGDSFVFMNGEIIARVHEFELDLNDFEPLSGV